MALLLRAAEMLPRSRAATPAHRHRPLTSMLTTPPPAAPLPPPPPLLFVQRPKAWTSPKPTKTARAAFLTFEECIKEKLSVLPGKEDAWEKGMQASLSGTALPACLPGRLMGAPMTQGRLLHAQLPATETTGR